MSVRKYIKHSNLPPRISISSFFLWFLVMERFDASGWVYGVFYTFLTLLALCELFRLFTHEAVDVVNE